MSPFLAMAAGLAASVVMNFILATAWLGSRDDAAEAARTASQQAAAAQQCSDGVASIERVATERAQQAELARDAAIKLAGQAQRRAMELVARKPTVPGDDCASARVQVDEWLANRSPR